MSNPRRFEPESAETEMPPFDDSFFEEFLDGGPFEGTEALSNSGANGGPKNVIAEYLKSIVDLFKFWISRKLWRNNKSGLRLEHSKDQLSIDGQELLNVFGMFQETFIRRLEKAMKKSKKELIAKAPKIG